MDVWVRGTIVYLVYICSACGLQTKDSERIKQVQALVMAWEKQKKSKTKHPAQVVDIGTQTPQVRFKAFARNGAVAFWARIMAL